MERQEKESSPIKKEELMNIFWALLVGVAVLPLIYSLAFFVRIGSEFILTFGEIVGIGGYWWLLPIIGVFGLIAGIIALNISPESEGPGLHVVISAFHKRKGILRLRTIPSKYIATFFTIGWGGPSGLVGPSALLGNATGGLIGKYIKVHGEQIRTLSLCGIAAAVSTLLGTPLGAAIFAVEVVYSDKLLYRRLFYCLISSITATLMTFWLDIRLLKFTIITELPSPTPLEVALMVGTAFMVMVLNLLYIKLYQTIHDFFRKWSWRGNDWIEPMFGMLMGAVLVIPLYSTLLDLHIVGGGQIEIEKMMDLEIIKILLLAGALFLSTALISGSQGSGGLFMPVTIIGMLIGLAVASAANADLPIILMAAGISAALCTTLNVPIASAIIPIELFGPVALFPSCIGALVGYIFAKRFIIYHEISWDALKKNDSGDE